MDKAHLFAPFNWVKREISQIPVNNNILINSNFKNPINQRGLTTYDRYNYSIDRWLACINNTGSTVVVNEGYITLNLKAGGNNIEIIQKQEFPELFNGKTVTLSMKARVSVGAKATLRILYYDSVPTIKEEKVEIEGTGEWGIYKVTTTINMEGIKELRLGDILLYESETNQAIKDHILDIEWVKAELGSQATPYVPRLYGEELELCQRYYQRLDLTATGDYVGPILATGATTASYFLCEFIKPMRTSPTLKVVGSPKMHYMVDAAEYNGDITSISTLASGNSRSLITISHPELNRAHDRFLYLNNGYLEFDAEI